MRQSLLVVGGAVVLLVGAACQFCRPQPGTKLGLAAAQPLRFRFIAPCVNEAFFNPVKRGMRDAASMLGVQCEFVGTEDVDIPAQAALVRQAVSDGCDGIALAIIDPTGFDAVIQDAQSKRVPVIAFNVDDNATTNARLSAVCQDLYKAGRAAGETAIPLIPAGSKILMTRHSQGISALEDRLRGMQEVLGSKGITWEVLTTGTTPAAAQEAVIRFLQTHPECRWILCTGLADTEGAGLAVEKQFQLRGCCVGGFDLSAEVLRLLKAGIIRFAVDQQPYLQGFYPVVQLTHYCRYGLKPSNIDVGAKVLGPQDADAVIEYSRKGYR